MSDELYDMEQLYAMVRSKKFSCLDRKCPVFELCPERNKYSNVDKDAWLSRNCPKLNKKPTT